MFQRAGAIAEKVHLLCPNRWNLQHVFSARPNGKCKTNWGKGVPWVIWPHALPLLFSACSASALIWMAYAAKILYNQCPLVYRIYSNLLQPSICIRILIPRCPEFRELAVNMFGSHSFSLGNINLILD